jgi:uncharacterized membrane protein
MRSLKIVGFVLIAIGIAYGVIGLVQKSNENASFMSSFLVAGGMFMTGLMAIMFSVSKKEED